MVFCNLSPKLRSRLYIDGATLAELVVDNEGVHGMVERCKTTVLSSGSHLVYIEGWKGCLKHTFLASVVVH